MWNCSARAAFGGKPASRSGNAPPSGGTSYNDDQSVSWISQCGVGRGSLHSKGRACPVWEKPKRIWVEQEFEHERG